jgi:hypothetical protein
MRRGEPLNPGAFQLVAPYVIQWTKAYKGMPSHLEHTSSHKVTDLLMREDYKCHVQNR